MRIKKGGHRIHEGDMTPMIDMTFQLIAFFMVLINFSQTEQNERILLPSAALAKPPDSPIETPITLHVTRTGSGHHRDPGGRAPGPTPAPRQ
jgi:biopolymer transport protein ExbD